jgi:HEAT repeat protein
LPTSVLCEIVYVLARDNEDERVLEMLTSRPEIVFALCELASSESEARWQIAVALGRIGGVEASARLQRFVDDPEEYVRRRATLALQEIER